MRNRYLTLLTTTALLTAAVSVGQPQTVDPSTGMNTTAPTSTTVDPAPSSPPNTATSATSTPPSPSTAPNTATPATTANALQEQDATFLQRAMEMGRLEVAHAQTALENASRNDTRTAARMLLDDHQRANQQLQQLASRKGWSVPTESAAAESDQARMATSAGGFDDDRFMTEQIRMHRDAISLFRAQSSSGTDPELRQFARDQLPHLEHHLEMLQGQHTQK